MWVVRVDQVQNKDSPSRSRTPRAQAAGDLDVRFAVGRCGSIEPLVPKTRPHLKRPPCVSTVKHQVADETGRTGGEVLASIFAVLMGSMMFGQTAPGITALGLARTAAVDVFKTTERDPPIDSFSEEGLKLDSVKGHVKFESVGFSYVSDASLATCSRPWRLVLFGLWQLLLLLGELCGGKSRASWPSTVDGEWPYTLGACSCPRGWPVLEGMRHEAWEAFSGCEQGEPSSGRELNGWKSGPTHRSRAEPGVA